MGVGSLLLLAIMFSIEHVQKVGLNNIYLECDSRLVVKTFKNNHIDAWGLRVR